MKTICFTLGLLLTFTLCAQRTLQPWGTWGLGKLNNPTKDFNLYAPFNIEGFTLSINWSDLEPTKGQYNWAYLDSRIEAVKAQNMFIGLLILYGPNCPVWIYEKTPQVFTTGGNNDGPYPYYFHNYYKKNYYNIVNQIAQHIAAYPKETKSFIAWWQITEGSTGDPEPYKGTPIDSAYVIPKDKWVQFRKDAWDSVWKYSNEAGRTYKILFNPGNDAEDLDYIEARYPAQMNKDGHLSHRYGFNGEAAYFFRQLDDVNNFFANHRTRGEVQQVWGYDWWIEAPLQNAFALICSALAGTLGIFNMPGGWINQTGIDTRPTDFFNKYADYRRGAQTNKGFCALRDVIDFADTNRFKISIYGPVVDPAARKRVEKKWKEIEDGTDSLSYQYWQKIQLVARNLNPARVNMLVQEYAANGAEYNPDNANNADCLHNDFGVVMAKNYSKHLFQLRINETSIGRYRIGPDTGLYGRYCREFKIVNEQAAMWFKAHDSLYSGATNHVQITVVYFDGGNGKWSVSNGSKEIKMHNTNTKQWLTQVFDFPAFVARGYLDGTADFAINYITGANTKFTLIEFINLDKTIANNITLH